jgi:hypothetical protein
MKVTLTVRDYWGFDTPENIQQWRHLIEKWGFEVKIGKDAYTNTYGECQPQKDLDAPDRDGRIKWRIVGQPLREITIEDIFIMEREWGIFEVYDSDGKPEICLT